MQASLYNGTIMRLCWEDGRGHSEAGQEAWDESPHGVYRRRVVAIMMQVLISSPSDCHYPGGLRPQAAIWLLASS